MLDRKFFAAALLLAGIAASGCGSDAAPAGVWGQADATEVDINTKVPGRLTELYVQEGSIVRRGQVLARIDAREQQAKTAAAAAQMAAARASVLQAEANLNNARQDLRRYASLYEQGATSEQNYDSYKTACAVAEAAFAQASQSAAAAEENLRQMDLYLQETAVVAPFDGLIVSKYADPGAMISTGMPIVALQDPLDNWADFKVKETELERYAVGQTVEVQGRSAGLRLQGRITDISRKPDFASYRTTSERGDAGDIIAFNVKVQLNDRRVRPGMRFCLLNEAEGAETR